MFKIYSWVPFFIIAIDQMTKRAAAKWGAENLVEWTSFLQGKTVWNKGISFGMLSDAYYNLMVYSLVWVGILLVMVAWMRSKNKLDTIGWGLVVGGGISNLWDRWIFGAVLDFISFHINDWYFPIFNVADIAISIGAIILMRSFFSIKAKKTKE
jgi:signal peptidase II